MSKKTATPAALPEHLLPLWGEDWALWRTTALRGAGFPAEMVLGLAAPEASAAADAVAAAEGRFEAAREEALEAVRPELDRLAEAEQWDERKPLVKAVRALKKGKIPATGEGDVHAAACAAMAQAKADLEASRADFDKAFEAAIEHQADAICEVAADPRFREAVLWQNWWAFKTAIDKVPAKGEVKSYNASWRHLALLVAKYLQRYTSKNDTVGFFGPVGWATFKEEGPAVEVKLGEQMLDQRQVILEAWALDQVAVKMLDIEGVEPWLRPLWLPLSRIIDGKLFSLLEDAPRDITPAGQALLESSDGQHTVGELVERVSGDPAFGVSADEALELLRDFVEQGVVDWRFHVPVYPYALPDLERQVREIGDEGVRSQCLAMVEAMETARQRVEDAAGHVEALDAAIAGLNETFSEITGLAATRNAGQTYGGRTLLYEECRRDVEVNFGPEVIEAVAAPVGLILTSARYYTHAVAESFRRVAKEIYDDMSKGPDGAVRAVFFWNRIERLFVREGWDQVLDPVLEDVRNRWLEILGVTPDQRRVQLSSADLRARVEETFACPGPGWQMARYHSPDVMISASSVEAMQAGDFELILGEIHVGRNTINCWVFVCQHPDQQQFFDDVDLDMPEPRVLLTLGRDAYGINTRTRVAHMSSRDLVIPPPDSKLTEVPEEQHLAIKDLIVVETPQGIELQTHDGNLKVDIAEAVGQFLSHRLMNPFTLLGSNVHWPRVTIDKMVVNRESWSRDAAEMTFAQENDERDRFLGARRWAQQLGLPRFVFVRVPTETKPFYVDLESVAYVELMCKMVRGTQDSDEPHKSVKISEMLPTQDNLWLPDNEGNHYTAELRLVITDANTNHPKVRLGEKKGVGRWIKSLFS